MDLHDYSTKDLLLTAIKSEEDSYQLYSTLNSKVPDGKVSDQLDFLSNEELKHKSFLKNIFNIKYSGEKVDINSITTDVPLPMLDLQPGYYPTVDLLDQVKESELITSDFYDSWSLLDGLENEMKELLIRLSKMEKVHYEIVSSLKETAVKEGLEKIRW